jgi:hypothetical protein
MKIFGEAEGYKSARKSLVHALRALSIYDKEAIVVVGAQAVYLQCEDDDLPFSPFTFDSDLAVDPRLLDEIPPIRRVLEQQGYMLRADGQPGLYRGSMPDGAGSSAVDILVPDDFAIGAGRRDANLPGDNDRAARRTVGLEAALYDKDLRSIADPDDRNVYAEAYVAGPAALIFAKAQKIAERSPDRLKAKDAADVFRLLRAHEAGVVRARITSLRQIPAIGDAVDRGIRAARDVFVNGTKGRLLFATLLAEAERAEFLPAYDALTEELGMALQ